MSEPKLKANCTCRECLKGASSFLKTQIALLRVNGRSSETSAAISKLKACIKILNEARPSTSDTVSDDAKTAVMASDNPGNAPVRAQKPGAYVKNYFSWLVSSGVKLPESTICDGMNLRWSVRNLDLWRPLFATKETLTQDDRRAIVSGVRRLISLVRCCSSKASGMGISGARSRRLALIDLPSDLQKPAVCLFRPMHCPEYRNQNTNPRKLQQFWTEKIATLLH